MEAALLWVAPRLLLDARAALRVLRGHLCRLHGDREGRQRGAVLRRVHPVLARALRFLRRGHGRLRAVARVPREPLAEDAVPDDRRAALGLADGAPERWGDASRG